MTWSWRSSVLTRKCSVWEGNVFITDLSQLSCLRFLEEDRKEMSDLRRQHQELLNVEVDRKDFRNLFFTANFRVDLASLWVSCTEHFWGNMRASRMTLGCWARGMILWIYCYLQWVILRYDDMMTSHSAAVAKLEHSQVGEVIREQFWSLYFNKHQTGRYLSSFAFL